ncbi:MAG: chromate transporter [Firmicutes bacterium HGW-Firmicutes-11]|jgi:chromate transporter|nr:MAG: chromate transporter [Firmicutes bacterium HGW-Firmicutes-11]
MKPIFQLFLTFLKIGTFTFGGGYAMIPAIRRETVLTRGWVTEDEIADSIAICQTLPGAFAVNIGILIGNKVKGWTGALAACLGVVFPAFVSILLVLLVLGQIDNNVYVLGALEGIKAASVGLILVTMYQMGRGILKKRIGVLIAIVSFLLIVFLNINAVIAIVFGGIIGYFELMWAKRKEGREKQ